ncbi:hypothetical protein [Streptomyces sp. NPDC096013]|uniref:hypothetical protein n=1 Tax=Streptomyces sp. NPDC096013 TaxID=3366069 RepID=UPI00381139BB
MANANVLGTERTDRVAAAKRAMLAQESPVTAVPLVDILSGRDTDAVAFTSAWETEE